MYMDDQEDAEHQSYTTYTEFDMYVIKNTYLQNKFKTEQHQLKMEASSIKREKYDGHKYTTKSFFERLGPTFKDMPI